MVQNHLLPPTPPFLLITHKNSKENSRFCTTWKVICTSYQLLLYKQLQGNSLAIPWLGCAFTAEGDGFSHCSGN